MGTTLVLGRVDDRDRDLDQRYASGEGTQYYFSLEGKACRPGAEAECFVNGIAAKTALGVLERTSREMRQEEVGDFVAEAVSLRRSVMLQVPDAED
jgi:hypothetical protein